ncbi:sigma-70 family RNA polymerase sigma factor [Clostridioides difficile]|nr:sigma-70 family RNA polymerase sigma factor [Clostridioides difficile]MCW0758764.1 sigma-70 family RNA polymerase sigma factor [Clostridioides difficile]MDK3213461.1 sigma-70 family RNA polymerase sigma factor [Clostridioides difficile]MDK3292030.1 sigma-70 family RNA polymerase sigma factor [Clostridioides difficile]HBF2253991.1 sigma-70 family RNA polymerase sigma factor [Clostridioides difficile]
MAKKKRICSWCGKSFFTESKNRFCCKSCERKYKKGKEKNVSSCLVEETKEYLIELGNKKRRVDILRKEIDFLKDKEFYREINFNELGFKIHSSPKGIDEMIMNNEDKISFKESEIDFIEYRLRLIDIYISELTEEKQQIIKFMYFYDGASKLSNEEIASKIKCSRSNVYYKHKEALKELAEMLFESGSLL